MVFVTIVTNERKNILTDNIEFIKIALKSIKYNFDIIAINILKNHIHMIIKPENMENIPQIIGFFKSNFTKNYRVAEGLPSGCKVWQSSYYDHIIRNEKDLNKHIDYIHYNSVKHYKISPKNWHFSSFKKFVKNGFYDENWLNFEDKNNINNLNLE